MSVSTQLTMIHQRRPDFIAGAGLYTVAVRLEDDSFVLEHDNGVATIHDGSDLVANMPMKRLQGADIRIWLDQSMEPAPLARLRDILREMADRCGAVVWGPPRDGYCELIPACADLAAFNGHDAPAQWNHYQPDSHARCATRPTRTVGSCPPAD